MKRKKNNQLTNQVNSYLKDNLTIYIFAIVLFMMGVIFGSFIINSLSESQKQELIYYIGNFFQNINGDNLQNPEMAFKEVLIDNIKYLGIIWFLGLSIIGMPLIFMVIFMKGFLIGFTISFFISELHWKGFMFALVSIIPQNLIIVPVLIIASVTGTLFSISLIKGRDKSKTHKYQYTFVSYSFLILMLAGVLFIASLYETYITPYLMRMVTSYLFHT